MQYQQNNIVDLIIQNKGEDIFNQQGIIIATALSRTHLYALAEKLRRYLKKSLLRTEGLHFKDCNWIYLEQPNYEIHLFLQESREFYSLETLQQDEEL